MTQILPPAFASRKRTVILFVCGSQLDIASAFNARSADEKITFLTDIKPISVLLVHSFFLGFDTLNASLNFRHFFLTAALQQQTTAAFFFRIHHFIINLTTQHAGSSAVKPSSLNVKSVNGFGLTFSVSSNVLWSFMSPEIISASIELILKSAI